MSGPGGARAFTLATWNVHGCVGAGRRFDLSRVARVLLSLDADVAALQEVGDVRGRYPAIDQARALATETGMSLAFMANLSSGRRRYGNAILSRHPIAYRQEYDLTVPGHEPRGCLRADVSLGGGRQIHVFNLHLGLALREKRRQAMLLSADILHDAALAFPMVVVGDFNRWRMSPMRSLLRRALRDGALALDRPEPTFPARVPIFRLDRIFLGEGLRALDVEVVSEGEARLASDHLPLKAVVELAEQPPAARAGAGLLHAGADT